MPVKIKCSNCDKVLSVPDAARGKAIKCPACQSKIAVPAEKAVPTDKKAAPADKKAAEKTAISAKMEAVKPAAAKSKSAKKPAEPIDSMEALVTFDMRRAEDHDARICVKCGYDMQFQDEEDTECQQCGFDSASGGLGARARKKAMKGPDPADFYRGLVGSSWKFVGRNQKLAWRTVMYTLIAMWVAIGCAFCYLYLSMWPTRVFFGLIFAVSFFVIPGWMWFLDTEVIKLTLERKDKFKKLNFDFFLASALGAAFVLWCCFFAAPIILIPAALGYFFVSRVGGVPDVVLPICVVIGLLPSLLMLPVCMSHFSMPVQRRGWMVWKVVPDAFWNIKPLSYWFLWFVLTNIPLMAGIATIAAVYGPDLANTVAIMEENADVARQKKALEQNPNTKKKGQPEAARVEFPDPKPFDLMPAIVPCIILTVMCVINGFTSMFNMRTNGEFTYYNKARLDLVDKRKEYKYVAKERVDEDDDLKPRTVKQMIVEAASFFLIFDAFGLIGGLLYGSFTNVGMIQAIFYGISIGQSIAGIALFFQTVIYAFQQSVLWGFISLFGCWPIGFLVFVFQEYEARKPQLIKIAVAFCLNVFLNVVGVILLFAGLIKWDLQMEGAGPPIDLEEIKRLQEEGKKKAEPAQKPKPGEDAAPPL